MNVSEADHGKWKTLGSRYLHRRPWLTVRQDELQLPNGNTIPEYYVLEYPDWVNILAITLDHKFVFVKQYRHAIGRVSPELCAGVCEPEDDSPLVSAKRELEEETGYGNGTWELFMVISANPSTHTNLTYCYLATDVDLLMEPHPESSEYLTTHLFSFDEVTDMLERGDIVQALHAAPLWKYIAEYTKR